MTKFIAAALGFGALATMASADISGLDTNGDGMLTIEEVQAAYPEVGTDQFSQIDANGDGGVDDAEMKAAQDAGLMPSPSDEG